MKKSLFIGAALMVFGVSMLTSCKKEITCDCTSLTTLATTQKTTKAKSGDEAKECADISETVLLIPIEVCVPQ